MGWIHQVSQAMVKTLVFLNMVKVRSFMALSDRGSLPTTERSWILHRHSQRISIGASGVQIVAMLVQLHSSFARVMVA